MVEYYIVSLFSDGISLFFANEDIH